jgi:hypothetical protein
MNNKYVKFKTLTSLVVLFNLNYGGQETNPLGITLHRELISPCQPKTLKIRILSLLSE